MENWKLKLNPLPEQTTKELFSYLQEHMDKFGCNGTRRYTKLFCKMNKINFDKLAEEFLDETGGCCCDCEVLMNSLRDDEYALGAIMMEDKK